MTYFHFRRSKSNIYSATFLTFLLSIDHVSNGGIAHLTLYLHYILYIKCFNLVSYQQGKGELQKLLLMHMDKEDSGLTQFQNNGSCIKDVKTMWIK